MRRQTLALIATVVLVVSSVGGGLAASDADLTAVDDGTRLATADGAQEYAETGTVTGSVDSMQLDVTVADQAGAVNASGLHLNQLRTFIAVDYDEGVHRDVRIHINGSIVAPRLKEGKQPIEAENVTADFHVSEAGAVQSMTLHLRGETDAVFAMSVVAGRIQQVRRTVGGAVRNGVENITGWSPPTFGGGEWERVNSTALSGENVSTPLPQSDQLTVQYQTSDKTWLPVPECQADDPVCTVQRDNRTHVVSTTSDAPNIRYKTEKDMLAGLESGWDDVTSVPGDIEDSIEDLLGGGS